MDTAAGSAGAVVAGIVSIGVAGAVGVAGSLGNAFGTGSAVAAPVKFAFDGVESSVDELVEVEEFARLPTFVVFEMLALLIKAGRRPKFLATFAIDAGVDEVAGSADAAVGTIGFSRIRFWPTLVVLNYKS